MSERVHPAGNDEDEEKNAELEAGVLSDGDSSSEEENTSETGLSENQNRLLYLVKLYTHTAKTATETEEWLNKKTILVLIYEGVVAQVFDYDYAPASELVENARKYFNVSQEGKSDLDFLREDEFVNGLKVSSSGTEPDTCYQVSTKGEDLVKRIGKNDKEAVHELVYAPGTRELLQVKWDGEAYKLESSGGYARISSVTDTEDVSYVSSAYVPQCLRHGGRPTLSNAHRAHECGAGESAIRDELDEVITLNSVSIIVAEYFPFGANQIVQLNNNLGSTERVQGGFYIALIDKAAEAAGLGGGGSAGEGGKYHVPPGLTSVNILDYTLAGHVNFEADIHFPVEDGVVQVETFGVSANADGTCFYGMQVEAIMDRIKDNISLDHLSRLLVDVHQDSSKIIDSVVSEYQRQLVDLIFQGSAENRDKVNLIIANEITPHLTAEEYMDKGEYENELKQVLGDTRAAFDISEHDTLVFGAHGLLVAGPNSRHHEPLLCSFLQFQSMDIFLQNFFSRSFVLVERMKNVRHLTQDNHMDPNSFRTIRAQIEVLSVQVTYMEEILRFVHESLREMVIPSEPPEQAGRSLYERLDIAQMKDQLLRRAGDLDKLVRANRHELTMLLDMSTVVTQTQMYELHQTMNSNMDRMCSLQDSNKQSSQALDMILIVLASTLAFRFLDRLTGEWTVVNTTWMQGFVEPLMKNNPVVWFFLNMLLFAGFARMAFMITRWLRFRSRGLIQVRVKVNRPIDLAALKRFLLAKGALVCGEDHFVSDDVEVVTVAWTEGDKKEWGNMAPIVSVTFDERNEFLLAISIEYNRRIAKKNLAFNAHELREKVQQELSKAEVYLDEEGDGELAD